MRRFWIVAVETSAETPHQQQQQSEALARELELTQGASARVWEVREGLDCWYPVQRMTSNAEPILTEALRKLVEDVGGDRSGIDRSGPSGDNKHLHVKVGKRVLTQPERIQADEVWGVGAWVLHEGCSSAMSAGQDWALHSVKYHELRD